MVKNRSFIAALGFVAALAACSQNASITGSGSSSSGGATPTPTTSDVYKIVTTGGPLGAYNAATGFQSDVAVNSSTGLPAVAYVDRYLNGSGTSATGALKYAYMDATGAWNVEVVDLNYSTGGATCGSVNSFCMGAPNGALPMGTIVRLRFKSDGTPAIAYVYGASSTTVGTKQVRFAERSTSGVWTINVAYATTAAATAASISPIKALNFVFDSSDRPHMTFAAYGVPVSTASQSYSFRSSGGSWTTSVVSYAAVPGAGVGAGAFTQGAGTNSSGIALCSNSPNITATLASGAGLAIANPTYSSCTATNGSGMCTAFHTVNMMTACGGSCFLSGQGMYTYQNTGASSAMWMTLLNGGSTYGNKHILGLVMRGATWPTPVSSGVAFAISPSACSGSQISSSWTMSGVSQGSWKPGLLGFEAANTAADVFAAYSVGTTASYINVSAATVTGFYTPSGAVVASAADIYSGATNYLGMGLGVYGTTRSDSHFYMSFASNASGTVGANLTNSDLLIGHGPAVDIASGGLNGVFTLDNVDQTMNGVIPNAVSYAGFMIDSDIGANGTMGYAYAWLDPLNPINTRLYYGIRGGPSSSPAFAANQVVNFQAPTVNSLHLGMTFDANSNPVVAFHANFVSGALYVARSFNGGATFDVVAVDRATTTAGIIGAYPSVARAGNALGAAYQDVTNSRLKYARWTATTGWRKYIVDGTGSTCDTSGTGAAFTSIAHDSDNMPVIVYQWNGGLKVARGYSSDNITFYWTCVGLDAAANTRAYGTGVAIDSSNLLSIAHFDATAGSIRHVYTATAASAAIATGAAAFTAEAVGSTGVTSPTVNNVSVRIKQNTSGTRFISYYTTSGLILATKTSGGSWSTESIGPAISGTYSTLQGSFGALTLNSGGYPSIFYRSNENWIRYFSREVQ